MKKITLDKEEREILDAIEDDKFVSENMDVTDMEELRLIARNTFAKSRNVNIRISERDLLRIKAQAARAGIPYQTFITSTLHKKAARG